MPLDKDRIVRIISTSEKDGRLRYFLTNLAFSVFVFAPIEVLAKTGNQIVALALIVPALYLYIASAIRRCNDVGVSSRFLFLYLFPPVGMMFGVYLLFAPANTGINKKTLAYGAGVVTSVFAIGIIASMALTKESDPDIPPASKSSQKPEIDFSYEPPASPPHPSAAFQQVEAAPVVSAPPVFDTARQAELARKADAERFRRDMESYKERERFYAKQYAERDIARCNIKPVMTDAEILACRDR